MGHVPLDSHLALLCSDLASLTNLHGQPGLCRLFDVPDEVNSV